MAKAKKKEEKPEYNIRCLYDEIVLIDILKPNPDNPNTHPPEQIERLAMILREQGVRRPIRVSTLSGLITAGHGQLEAMKLNGWKTAPVNRQNYDNEDQEYADMVADNSLGSWASLDLGKINLKIEDLGPDLDINLLGIKDFEIESADKFHGDEDSVPDPPKKANTKTGDVWILGDHRLLCGDSTDSTQVERLMGDEKSDLFLTDPPYGVSYVDKNEYLNSLGKAMACPKRIENDHQTPEQMYELWIKAFKNGCDFSTDKASYYIFAPQGGDLLLLLQAVRQAGWQLKHILVWAKNNHVLGRCDYHYKHEPIVYGWKINGTHEFYGNGQKNTSVWDFNKPLKNDLHPTMKPVEVLAEALLNSTQKEHRVLDLFAGSSSTIIACEKTGRRCFAMEIDPIYVDVAVKRWEDYTGKKAVLEK